MKLKEAAERVKRDSINAWMRRVNWRFMDERIQLEFENLASDKDSVNLLGGLYISRAKDNEPIRNSNLTSSKYINSTHIFTGHRLLGISVVDTETKKLKIASERNAQLWYSQGPPGDVLVFVGPYQSDVGETAENEIIIGKYQNPSQATAQCIRKHLSMFFKYCSCTAQHSTSSLSNYLYRKYLVFNDFRYKSIYRQKLIQVSERLLILALGGAAIWASLYVGDKI